MSTVVSISPTARMKILRADIARGLRDELIDALLTDPAKEVRTPGFADKETGAQAKSSAA